MADPAARLSPPSRSAAWLGGIGDAFGDANFRRYSVGAIVSWLSFFVQSMAVAWTAWSLSHSTRWLAAVALLDALPMSLLAPLGGIVADRHDRFRVLLVCYAFATAQSALLGLLAVTGRLTVEWLALLAFAHGLIHAFSVPSQFGLLPRFVEPRRLPSAIAVASAYTQLGLFAGPALAGWVLLHFGAATAFFSNVAGYGVYFLSAWWLKTPPGYRPTLRPKQGWGRDLVDGFRAIVADRGITRLLVLMVFGDALRASVGQMMPAYADQGLQAGVGGLSTLLASGGIGATLSALWLAQGGARRTQASNVIWAFGAFILATVAMIVSHTLWLAALAMVLRGFFFEISRTGTIALLQISVADAVRGRIMSTQFLLQQGAGSLGVMAVGAVAADWGLRLPVLVGCGVAGTIWLLVAIDRRRTRETRPISG